MKAIYGIINKINGNKYVGSAIDFYKRKKRHIWELNGGFHHSNILQKAWNKYGSDVFEFLVLEEVQEKENLIVREQWWIDNSNSKYNVCKTAGNTLGRLCSLETRKKISLKNSQPRTKGQILGQKNRRKPVDQYDLYCNFIKSWESTQDAGEFLRKNHKAIIDAASGRCNTAFGFRWAYKGESLKEVKRNNWKYIYQFNLNGEYIREWYTIQEAANYYGINNCCIVDCAKGNQKTSVGFIWRYEK